MTNSVLCAIDISHPGEDVNVLKKAAQLAVMEDAQLDVITVVPDYGTSLVGGFFSEEHHDQMMDEAKKQLNDQVTGVLGEDKNSKVRHVIAFGKTYEEVLKTAKAAGSSLIVVGAHKPDFADYLLGPNAARIVRHSTCSVYVVR
ncbi:universal stress protein [Lentilitoribacter sp. EG35]|uniref:universal stress protein n=1 Tax=Lentilitoribacter sp. EG35 TaxID=3234192 RepID=UPI00345FC91C